MFQNVPAVTWPPDEHTLALYLMNEGTGTLLTDASGNGHDGRILEAEWQMNSESMANPIEDGTGASAPDQKP